MNPITGVIKTLHNERGKREHLDYFTNGEVKLFLNMPEAFRGILPIFPLGFPRGARLGELLRFKWGDIDQNGKFIQIQRSYKLGSMNATKTGRIRRVDMSVQLFESLWSLFSVRRREGLQMNLSEAWG